jgi:class 3 adenylate cyclase
MNVTNGDDIDPHGLPRMYSGAQLAGAEPSDLLHTPRSADGGGLVRRANSVRFLSPHDLPAQRTTPADSRKTSYSTEIDPPMAAYAADRDKSLEAVNDDNDGGSSAGSVLTATSSGSAVKHAGVSVLRCCGQKLRVPFTIWTFLAMFVPIAFLIAVITIQLVDVNQELTAINSHNEVVGLITQCSSSLMGERGSMGPWLTRGAVGDKTALVTARAAVDDACSTRLARNMRRLSSGNVRGVDGDLMTGFLESFQTFLQGLAAIRLRVDDRNIPGRTARTFFTDEINTFTKIVSYVADHVGESSREYSEVAFLLMVQNYIGLARGVGNALAAATPSATSQSVLQEYLAGYAQATLGYRIIQDMSTPALARDVVQYVAFPETARMWQLLNTMADVDNGGAAKIQTSADATAWWADVTAGLQLLSVMTNRHLQRLNDAESAKKKVLTQSLLLGFGVTVCLVAAALLAWQQSRVKGQLEQQVQAIERTRRAVSAFVPRFFLQKMGYTSITQVRTGEATTLALAMLFADIRQFTTVAEGMSSMQLFSWVQDYFKRMTAIVEARRGNVNQFMGDALFAVFSTCKDSLMCAIDMQTDVQQLNVQRLTEDQDSIPVEVGIGIHHDVVAMGILGDDSRHTCTTISASVNLASRLEGLTKQVGCQIVASQAVVDQLSSDEVLSIRMRRMGEVTVKGSSADVVVFDVYHTDPRAAQLYKSQTKEAFERLAAELIHGKRDAQLIREHFDGLLQPLPVATARKRAASPVSPPLMRLPIPPPAKPTTESGVGDDWAMIKGAMLNHGVLDLPLSVIARMSDGSGRLAFDEK